MNFPLIEEYEKAGGRIRTAIAGLSSEQLNATPVPGTWSIQQIVLHLMDDEIIWTDRVKRVIAEETPPLLGFDESKFAARLHYELWSADEAVTIFELTRKNFAKVLRRLPDSVLQRKGVHSERGEMRLEEILPTMVRHVDHHLRFIHEKRAMLEKGK